MYTNGLFWIRCLHFLQKKVSLNWGVVCCFLASHVTKNQLNSEYTVKDVLMFFLRNTKTQNFHSPQFLQETCTDASSLSSFQKSASSANQRKLENKVITLHSITIALTFFLLLVKVQSTEKTANSVLDQHLRKFCYSITWEFKALAMHFVKRISLIHAYFKHWKTS